VEVLEGREDLKSDMIEPAASWIGKRDDVGRSHAQRREAEELVDHVRRHRANLLADDYLGGQAAEPEVVEMLSLQSGTIVDCAEQETEV